MYSKPHRDLGRRIARHRTALGWTQETLADRTGVSRVYLARLEQGQHDPKGSTLMKLAAALGITVSALFTDRHDVWRSPRHMSDRERHLLDAAFHAWIVLGDLLSVDRQNLRTQYARLRTILKEYDRVPERGSGA